MAKKKRGGSELWVIEFHNIDPSREATVAYKSRKEAIDVAAEFVGDQAKYDLESYGWEEGDEAPEMLKSILKNLKEGKKEDAIVEWLGYQREYDPREGISIGPSGLVSDSPFDFPRSKP